MNKLQKWRWFKKMNAAHKVIDRKIWRDTPQDWWEHTLYIKGVPYRFLEFLVRHNWIEKL